MSVLVKSGDLIILDFSGYFFQNFKHCAIATSDFKYMYTENNSEKPCIEIVHVSGDLNISKNVLFND